MVRVKLYDRLGYLVGTPEVPERLPRVIVWADEFFLFDGTEEDGSWKYTWISGFIVQETKDSIRVNVKSG